MFKIFIILIRHVFTEVTVAAGINANFNATVIFKSQLGKYFFKKSKTLL